VGAMLSSGLTSTATTRTLQSSWKRFGYRLQWT